MSELSKPPIDQLRSLIQQLSRPQRMTLVAFSVLIPATLLWLTLRDPDERWVTLTNSTAELDESIRALNDAGLTGFRAEQGQLLVPEPRVAEFHEVLKPVRDELSSIDADSESSESGGLFDWPDQRADRREEKLRRDICRLLMGIEGIAHADLRWAQSKGRRGFRDPDRVTASVFIRLEEGHQLNRGLDELLRQSVASMITDLNADDVHVIDRETGRMWSEAEALEQQRRMLARATSERLKEQITAALDWLPAARISVVPASGDSISPGTGALDSPSLTVVIAHQLKPDAVSGNELSDETELTDRVRSTIATVIPDDIRYSIEFETSKTSGIATATDARPGDQSLAQVWSVAGLVVAGLVFVLIRKRTDPLSTTADTAPPAPLNEDATVIQQARQGILTNAEDNDAEPASSDLAAGAVCAPGATPDRQPFDDLRNATASELSSLLQGEHPQTAAIVVRYLPIHLATDIARRMSQTMQAEVVRRIATVDQVALDVVHELDDTLCERFRRMKQQAICCSPALASDETASLSESTPAAQFEELMNIDDKTFRQLIDAVDAPLWQVAMQASSGVLQNRIRRALPRNVKKDPEQTVYGARIPDSDTARREILTALSRLGHDPNGQSPLARREFVA